MTASESTIVHPNRPAADLLSQLADTVIFAAATHDVAAIVARVVEDSASALRCDSALLLLRQDGHWVVDHVHRLPSLEGALFSDEEVPHAAMALMTRKPVFIEDAFNDMRANLALMRKHGINSLLAVPVQHGDCTFGALCYHFHSAPSPLCDAEKEYAAKVATALAAALHNAKTHQALIATKQDLTEAKCLSEALNRIEQTIYSSRDSEEILTKVLSEASDAIGAESAILFFREGEKWQVRSVHKLSQTLVGRTFSSDELRHTAITSRTRDPLAIDDAFHDSRVDPQFVKTLEIRSLLDFPLVVRGEVIGDLCFHYHSKQVHFTAHRISFARRLQNSISLAVQMARLAHALVESDSCLKMAQKIGKWGYFHYDRFNGRLHWSEGMYQIFGRSVALGAPTLEEFLHSFFLEEDVEEVRAQIVGEGSRHFEVPIRRDGALSVVQVLIDSLPCDKCEAAARLGTVQDISEQRQAESFKQGILDSLPAHIAVIDRDAIILDINQPWLRFAQENGAAGTEAIGIGVNYLSVCRRAAQESSPLAREALQGIEMVMSGSRDHFALEYPCDSPTEKRWYLMHVRPASHLGGAIIAHLDITERRLAEEALRQSEERFASFMRHLPAAAWMKDPQGRYLYINPESERTISTSLQEIQGKTDEEVFGQDMARLFGEKEKRVLAEGGIRTKETLPRPDGDHHFLVSRFAVPGSDGAPVQLCGVALDITDRIAAQEEVERLNAALEARAVELEQANSELEAFNYSVSHDLRQPLNIICGCSQGIMLECGKDMGESCREYVEQIYQTGLRMNGLIDAMLRFSRLSRSELRRETVNLSRIVKGIVAGFKADAPDREVEVAVQEGVMAYCDQSLLTLVLENLLGNAWKYSANNERCVIAFGAKREGEEEVFFVRDNGVGFHMAHAEKLFLPFQRLPGSERFRGHGIGLATVEKVVKRHGGRVWAEAEPGMGATFYFTLPK